MRIICWQVFYPDYCKKEEKDRQEIKGDFLPAFFINRDESVWIYP